MSVIRQLVYSTVRPTVRPAGMMHGELEVGLFEHALRPAARVAAYCGTGLDLQGGECLLAGIAAHSEDRGFEHRLAAAITTRRILYGGWSTAKGNLNDVRGQVLLDEILGLDAKPASMLKPAVFDVMTPRGPQHLMHLFGHFPGIEAFVRALLQVPAGARSEPGAPAVTPGADDPTGARTAAAQLWLPDERAAALLATIERAHAQGHYDVHTAIDLVGRVVLAHRAGACGPAGWGSCHLSPLSADDFGAVLVAGLGQPIGYHCPQPGTHWLDFRYDPKSDRIHAGLAALGIASFFALGVGINPGRMIAAELLAKRPITAIRVVYADVPGGCAYELQAGGARLEHGEAELAHALHQLLSHWSWPVLERRCALGWQLPYPQLFEAN